MNKQIKMSDNLQGQPDLENHQCVVCGVTQTPLRDHNHDHYLCNACRLYQRMNGGQLNLLIVSDSEQEDKPKELFAVTPLKTCPHLEQIKDSKVPSEGLNTGASCKKCSKTGENWVCLKCFEVYCSRYVEGHALGHTEETKHPLALSFADFSVWCYPCNSYIDNEVFEEAKKAAIKSKFGEVEIKNV